MGKRKRTALWNVLIVGTVLVCLLAFVEHYKNWYSLEDGSLRILSGIYYRNIPLEEMDSLGLVDKIPKMERSSGFSWRALEKGVFRDSINNKKVYVFVDDLHQRKIRLVHSDSLVLYLNLRDSLETQKLYAELQYGMAGDSLGLPSKPNP